MSAATKARVKLGLLAIGFLLLALLPLLAEPELEARSTVSVHFSPRGGCTDAIVAEINKAKQSVCVQAYEFTSPPIIHALVEAKNRGVNVQVVLDKSWPQTAPKAESALVEAGASVLIDGKHAIAHNKVVVIDGATVVTGSFNFTQRAETSNAENIVVLRNVSVGHDFLTNFLNHAEHSEPAPVPVAPSPSASAAITP